MGRRQRIWGVERKTRRQLAIAATLLWAFVLTLAIPSVAATVASFDRPAIAQTQTDPIAREREGHDLYTAGRFAEAARIWEETARDFADRGDIVSQAGSLNYQATALYELGELAASQNAVDRAISLLETRTDPGTKAVLAQTLNQRGRLELAAGQPETALETWQQAAQLYDELGDIPGQIGAQTNSAIALQANGLYRRSRLLLQEIEAELNAIADPRVEAVASRNLGIALRVVGDVAASGEVLDRSLVAARTSGFAPEIAATLLAAGNTARALDNPDAALDYYREAASIAVDPIAIANARLSELSLLVELGRTEIARSRLPQLGEELANLPPSRPSVYARVNFAATALELGETDADIARQLAIAVEQSRELDDRRAESYALGELGYLYERRGQINEALDLTRKAVQLAEMGNATDITAQWQEQLGRILKGKGDREGAIAAYDEAVNGLQSLREDLVAVNADVQFSFRDRVEPVYRELVSLLLAGDRPQQQQLQKALNTVESLQLAELENFFRESCLQGEPTPIDAIDAKAAVIYPIILSDRLEVIASLPGQPLRNYKTNLAQTEIESTLAQFRQSLSLSYPRSRRLELYSTVYDWLLRPIATDLANSDIETLVFVLDGSLRNMPMSVLYDGEKYLVEDYAIAIAPGLQLLESRPLERGKLEAFIGGLSEARQGFAALPGVPTEVDRIKSQIQANSRLDSEFTAETVREIVSQTRSPVLHLATHGQFSSNAEDTFILTWDDRINVSELGALLQGRDETRNNAIELLVLSACQTAQGDDRAVLGLAGLAVKSGARSTIATLWSVRDRSTADLMVEFYRQLSLPATNKATALRNAQLWLLAQPDYELPFYWAPFVLVGNWQ